MGTAETTRAQRRAAARDERRARERAALARARRTRRARLLAVTLGAAAALVVALIFVSESGRGGTTALQAGRPVPGAAATTAFYAGIPQSGVTLGSARAPVTMVEFGDLQCPVCRAYAEGVLPTLVRRYVRSGRLRLIFRNVSIIGPDSVAAARMAAAAGEQNRLWQYIALFYANQGQENSGYVNDAFLRQIGTGVAGLNVDRALAARGGPAVDGQLQQAEGQAAQLGIDATPSFLLGRRGSALTAFEPSQLSPDRFTVAIDRLLRA
jgi:protein-disulfide isomerase